MSLGFLVITIALLSLAWLAFKLAELWAPHRDAAELEARWAGTPSRWIEVEGLRVHLRDEGPADPAAAASAEPIVLIHGTGASLHTWDGWVEELRKQRRVLRFDLPGFGLTGPRADADYSIASTVRFTVALLDTLDIERCVLVGNSLGGEVAWGVAARHPERVTKLVLIDAAGYPPDWDALPLGFRLAAIPLLRPIVTRVSDRGLLVRSLRGVYGDPKRVSEATIERYAELMLRPGNRLALTQRLAMVKDTLAAEIPKVRAPTLLLWGERDRLIPLRHAHRFLKDIAGSTLVVLPGLGHVPQEEDPVATLAAAQAFLDTPAAARLV